MMVMIAKQKMPLKLFRHPTSSFSLQTLISNQMETNVEPQRVQELWFADGNIIIQAGNSQFRVFRGILAARSPVFQDMFSFPQPPDSELVEGCPVVRIPDHPSEVQVFLRAVFEPEFLMPHPAPTTFEAVTGCLRLSHKYGVDYLRRRSLIHLSSLFPTNLADYDAVWIEKTTYRSWPSPKDGSHCLFLIHLAREVDAPWILPDGFYGLAYTFATMGMGIFHGSVFNGIPVHLTAHDQQNFAAGYPAQIANCTTGFFHTPIQVPGCTQHEKCTSTRLRFISLYEQRRRMFFAVPLHTWSGKDWDLLNKDLCAMCRDVLRQTHRDARQAFWDKLPGMYGLPSWQELEERKRQALALGDDGNAQA